MLKWYDCTIWMLTYSNLSLPYLIITASDFCWGRKTTYAFLLLLILMIAQLLYINTFILNL